MPAREAMAAVPAADAAAVTSAAAGGEPHRMVYSRDDPGVVEWHVHAQSLLRKHASYQTRLTTQEFTLGLPNLPAPEVIPVKVEAYSKDGFVCFFIWLPQGTRARWCQWLGPTRVKMRYATDKWDTADRFYGSHSFGRIEDQQQEGFISLGFALLVVTPPGGLPTFPSYFRPGEALGEGSFGSVRECEDTRDANVGERQNLVVKISSRGESSDFRTEATVMSRIAGVGFPALVGHYVNAKRDKEILVMEKLHRNLESLREDPEIGGKGILRPETIVGIGVQIVDRLERMHRLGFVHMDLKPDNIMIGHGRGDVLHLIDFGLSRHYMIMGHHLPPKESSLRGTARYCSIHAHRGLQSRRADLESLGHVLMYLAVGRLPWQGCTGDSKQAREEEILRKKSDEDLLNKHMRSKLPKDMKLADALLGMVKYCRELDFKAEPDYRWLRQNLEMAVTLRLSRVVSQEPWKMDKGAANQPEWRLDWVDEQNGSLTPAARSKAPRTGLLNPERPFFPTPGGSSARPSRNAVTNLATRGQISTAGEQATSRPSGRRADDSGYGTGYEGLDDSGYGTSRHGSIHGGRGTRNDGHASGLPSSLHDGQASGHLSNLHDTRGASGGEAKASPRPSDRESAHRPPRPSKRREFLQRIRGQEPTGLPPEGADQDEPPPRCVVM